MKHVYPLLESFLNLAEKRGRSFLREQEIFYILDFSGIKIPENMFISYIEDTDEKFKMKICDKSKLYSIKIVSDIIPPAIIRSNIVKDLNLINIQEEYERFKVEFPLKYAEQLTKSNENIPDKYKSFHSDVNELAFEILKDIKGFIVLEQIYYKKIEGSELSICAFTGEDDQPGLLIGKYDQAIENIYQAGNLHDGYMGIDMIDYEKEQINEKIKTLASYQSITGENETGYPITAIENVIQFIDVFACIIRKYSAANQESAWIVRELSASPCVCNLESIYPMSVTLSFSRKA